MSFWRLRIIQIHRLGSAEYAVLGAEVADDQVDISLPRAAEIVNREPFLIEASAGEARIAVDGRAKGRAAVR